MSTSGSSDFLVSVTGAVGSAEEWKRALHAEAEGASTAAPQEQAEERLKVRGRLLGERVNQILEGLGSEYRLRAVLWEGFRLRWLVRIESPQLVIEVPIPADLADGVVESGSLDDMERLKNLVLFGAGRQDLIFKRKI